VSAPIRRRRDGRYAVKLDPSVRAVLVTMSEQLAPVLSPDDPMTKRLFPPAYASEINASAERDYRDLVDNALINHHREAFTLMAGTAEAEVLTDAELSAWLSAIGAMRLVLGTRLDVSEDMGEIDPDDPNAHDRLVYEVLTVILGSIIAAMSA